jgi:NAD(P)-dependent dehydrogenase (short-subunit alcohol dehydrogenase family)
LLGLARASALDLGPYNVTVNCLAPGFFATDMPMTVLTPEQKVAVAARSALNRFGQPSELAGPALLLASEAGSYITGSVLVVDGGTLAKVF